MQSINLCILMYVIKHLYSLRVLKLLVWGVIGDAIDEDNHVVLQGLDEA